MRFKSLREAAGLDIEDIAAMTGFHRNTIVSIENGSNTDISHLLAYIFALNLHPKDFFDVPLEVQPLHPLPATRKEKNKLTSRTAKLIEEGFFDSPRSTSEVCEELKQKHPEAVNIKETILSTILKRQFDDGKLDRSGPKNRYLYQRKKATKSRKASST